MEDINQPLTEEAKVLLREQQTSLVKIVKAFDALEKSEEWTTVKELVFSKSLEAIERQIKAEALQKEVNIHNLYKLQGEWVWAKQYAEPHQFIENLKKQLEEIKRRLK